MALVVLQHPSLQLLCSPDPVGFCAEEPLTTAHLFAPFPCCCSMRPAPEMLRLDEAPAPHPPRGWLLTPVSPGAGAQGRMRTGSPLALLPRRAGKLHRHTWGCELQISRGSFACRRLLPREGKAHREINVRVWAPARLKDASSPAGCVPPPRFSRAGGAAWMLSRAGLDCGGCRGSWWQRCLLSPAPASPHPAAAGRWPADLVGTGELSHPRMGWLVLMLVSSCPCIVSFTSHVVPSGTCPPALAGSLCLE